MTTTTVEVLEALEDTEVVTSLVEEMIMTVTRATVVDQALADLGDIAQEVMEEDLEVLEAMEAVSEDLEVTVLEATEDLEVLEVTEVDLAVQEVTAQAVMVEVETVTAAPHPSVLDLTEVVAVDMEDQVLAAHPVTAAARHSVPALADHQEVTEAIATVVPHPSALDLMEAAVVVDTVALEVPLEGTALVVMDGKALEVVEDWVAMEVTRAQDSSQEDRVDMGAVVTVDPQATVLVGTATPAQALQDLEEVTVEIAIPWEEAAVTMTLTQEVVVMEVTVTPVEEVDLEEDMTVTPAVAVQDLVEDMETHTQEVVEVSVVATEVTVTLVAALVVMAITKLLVLLRKTPTSLSHYEVVVHTKTRHFVLTLRNLTKFSPNSCRYSPCIM